MSQTALPQTSVQSNQVASQFASTQQNEHRLMRNNVSNQEHNNKIVLNTANAGIGLVSMGDAFHTANKKNEIQDKKTTEQFANGFALLNSSLSNILISTVENQIENMETLNAVLDQQQAIKENPKAQQMLSVIKSNQVRTVKLLKVRFVIIILDYYTYIYNV